MPPKRLTRNEYTVGWICALPVQLAVVEVLDEEHQDLPLDSTDANSCSFGSIGKQVIQYGNVLMPFSISGSGPELLLHYPGIWVSKRKPRVST